MSQNLQSLVKNLKERGVLKTPEIIKAFEEIDRAEFVPEDMREVAYIDEALPIKEGQTISQPYTVAFMLELLNPKPEEKILDIGAGSGWQTCLLAHIVSSGESEGKAAKGPLRLRSEASESRQGRVFAMEIVPELCRFGKNNVAKFDFIEKGVVRWICGDASRKATFDSVGNEAPNGVDGIIAAASLDGRVPQEWKNQLKTGGRIVVPIKESIWLFIKRGEDDFSEKEYPGFVFVPFVKNNDK